MTDQPPTPGADPRLVIRLLSQEVARLTEEAAIAKATIATLTAPTAGTDPEATA